MSQVARAHTHTHTHRTSETPVPSPVWPSCWPLNGRDQPCWLRKASVHCHVHVAAMAATWRSFPLGICVRSRKSPTRQSALPLTLGSRRRRLLDTRLRVRETALSAAHAWARHRSAHLAGPTTSLADNRPHSPRAARSSRQKSDTDIHRSARSLGIRTLLHTQQCLATLIPAPGGPVVGCGC